MVLRLLVPIKDGTDPCGCPSDPSEIMEVIHSYEVSLE